MSHLETTGDQGRYNEVAIKYAGKIHRSRSASKLTSQPAVDDLFPSFNRPIMDPVFGQCEVII